MELLIPTYKRPNDQYTLSRFPKRIQKKFILIVREEEANLYHHPNLLVIPAGYGEGIGRARQYALEQLPDSDVVMFDDDLAFQFYNPEVGRMRMPLLEHHYYEMIAWFKYTLESGVSACGLGSKLFSNVHAGQIVPNSRMFRVLGYKFSILTKEGIRFDDNDLMCDFDTTLALLTKGYQTQVSYDFTHDAGNMSNAPGGCAEYRTKEFQAECAVALMQKYPDFVKLKTKKTKRSWDGEFRGEDGISTRIDVTIQWGRAAAFGLAWRKQRLSELRKAALSKVAAR